VVTGVGDGVRGVRVQHVVASGGSIVIQVAGDLIVSEEGLAASWALAAASPGECPYPGIGPFGPGQAKWYFGRDKLTGDLLGMLDASLRAGRGGPLMIVGASGAGKSSLLAAGLVKALGDGRLAVTDSEHWPVLSITPGSRPLETLTEGVSRCAGELAGQSADPSPGWESAFADLREALRRSGTGGIRQRIVVVVDKLEELFAVRCSDAERDAFLEALDDITAASLDGPAGLVILGMRADFYSSATQYPALREALQSRQLVVGAMTLAEVTQAITGPARVVGLNLEPGLTERLLRDLGVGADGTGYEPGRLPLLGQVLRETWRRRIGDRLTISGYEDAGGIGGAIAKTAEDAYNGLGPQAQQAARQLFLAMVQVGSGEPGGEGIADTRRRVSRDGLRSSTTDPGTAEAVLDVFTQARLVTSSGQTAEISHEALLARWPRLREWIDQDRAGHLIRQPLEEAAKSWDRAGRNPAADLYTGSRLAQAQAWADDPAASRDLSGRARDFLAASGRLQQRGVRRRNRIIAALVALSLLAVSTAAFAGAEDQSANQQRNAAVAGQLAVESEALDTTNPVEAASLATAAWKIDPTAQARDSLLDVLAQPARATITVASGNVMAIKFSRDGKLFATATDTGVAQVWDTATRHEIGKPLQLGSGSIMYSISFAADDVASTVTGDGPAPVRLWNITTRRPIGSPFQVADELVGIDENLFSPDGKVIAAESGSGDLAFFDSATHYEIGSAVHAARPLAFSPDGKFLAVGLYNDRSNDETAGLLNVTTHHLIRTYIHGPVGHEADAAFSPDGKVLAVTGAKSVDLWDIARRRLIGPPLAVAASPVIFSPDGKMLATVGSDGVDLWNAGSHQQLGVPLTADGGAPLAFSPDSKVLATATGSTVTFWNLTASRQVGATILQATAPAIFSPNGKLLAAVVEYGAALWSITGRRQVGTTIVVNPHHAPDDTDGAGVVAFSPDGKTLATGGSIGVPVQLWSVATHQRTGVREFPGHGDISAVAFSPDGRLLATSDGFNVWISDVRTGRVVGPKISSGDNPNSNVLAFSPDGTLLLAIIGRDARLYSVATHHQVGTPLAVGTGQVNDIAFSPDGSIIAIASQLGASLWDVVTHQQIGAPLTAGVGAVQAVAFSPDGTLLATADADGSIRLWDVTSREQVGPALAVDSTDGPPIVGLAFSPDGNLLAAATSFWTQMWGVGLTQNTLRRVCAIAGGSMTLQQWNSSIKSEAFRQTCT
jgi:WD40 repeat protein